MCSPGKIITGGNLDLGLDTPAAKKDINAATIPGKPAAGTPTITPTISGPDAVPEGPTMKTTILGGRPSTESVKPGSLKEAINMGVGRSLVPDRYKQIQTALVDLTTELGIPYDPATGYYDFDLNDNGDFIVTDEMVEKSGMSEEELVKKLRRAKSYQDRLQRSDKDTKQETATLTDAAEVKQQKDIKQAAEDAQVQEAVGEVAKEAFNRVGTRATRTNTKNIRKAGALGKIQRKTLIGF